eukprot:g6360.t1
MSSATTEAEKVSEVAQAGKSIEARYLIEAQDLKRRPGLTVDGGEEQLRRVSRWPGLVAKAHDDKLSTLSRGTAAGALPPLEPGGMPKAGAEGRMLNA